MLIYWYDIKVWWFLVYLSFVLDNLLLFLVIDVEVFGFGFIILIIELLFVVIFLNFNLGIFNIFIDVVFDFFLINFWVEVNLE